MKSSTQLGNKPSNPVAYEAPEIQTVCLYNNKMILNASPTMDTPGDDLGISDYDF